MSNRQSWRYAHGDARGGWLQRQVQRWLPSRQQRGAQTAAWRTPIERGPAVTLLVFGLVLGTLLGLILAVPVSATASIAKGQPSPISLVAPRLITYESDILTRKAQDEAANNPANIVADTDQNVARVQREAMQQLFDNISRIRASDAANPESQAETIGALPSFPVSPTLALQIAQLPPERWQVVMDESRKTYDQIWQNRTKGLDAAEVETVRERVLPYFVSPGLNETERAVVVALVGAFLRPNSTINEEATRLRQESARASVAPVTVTIAKGEPILRAGEVVTEETHEKLLKLGLVFGAGGGLAILQKFLLGLLAAWLFATFLWRYQTNLWRNRRGLLVIGGVMAAAVLAGRILVPLWETAPYAFPLAAVAIILTVLFDGRIGLIASLTIAPLIGLQTEQSIGLAVTLGLGSAAGVFMAHRTVRSISFVYVGLAVTLLTMLGGFVFWLEPVNEWPMSVYVPFFSLLNGAQATVLAIGTYQILGRVANVVTPLQLMELAHPNQPLLHRLMREAPGTYHHSMVVSNLAEMAAENIGADALLARVGAYYHDVGKILRPYFFTDNQHERSNVHDVLDAKTSASIIIDHVREGVKLAREHGLPQQVIDFIQQHHGTSLVSFFYQRAFQEEGDPDIEDFRYPGPKPQTCEAGIMMLADGVEATVRSRSQSGKLRPIRLDEEAAPSAPGTQSIGEVVEQIVTERVRSGQLDECPLTLRDIAVIKESFVKTLQGIYHPRVDYPQQASEPVADANTPR